jgi:hypothetical protein
MQELQVVAFEEHVEQFNEQTSQLRDVRLANVPAGH